MSGIARFPYDFNKCMFISFFHEFEHLEKLQGINLDIHIESRPQPIDDYGKPEIQDIHKNNLKLFFHPSNPPCNSINRKLEAHGFIRTAVLYDRWIYSYEKP